MSPTPKRRCAPSTVRDTPWYELVNMAATIDADTGVFYAQSAKVRITFDTVEIDPVQPGAVYDSRYVPMPCSKTKGSCA